MEVTTDRIEETCQLIESALARAAEYCKESEGFIEQTRRNTSAKLTALIQQRRQLRSGSGPEARAEISQISKMIQRESRAILRAIRKAKVQNILDEAGSLKRLTGFEGSRRRTLMTSICDKYGNTWSGRQQVADVFADFYAELYRGTSERSGWRMEDEETFEEIPPFTREEIEDELKRLKRKRAKDAAGLTAELLQHGGADFIGATLALFNEIIKSDAMAPADWKVSNMTVLFKAGNAKDPQNYRPITIIRVLY